jgi:hypothetical protein
MNSVPQPCLDFEWRVYDDATFAGLAPLIPIPLVDWFFERFFRRRIVRRIARYRGRPLSPAVIAELNRTGGCLATLLAFPVALIWRFVKSLLHTILYFLSIKSATDKLSRYWHRAFLIDCMLQQGHLDDLESARLARRALERTLTETSTSPMMGLARGVVASSHHVLRTLWRARRNEEDQEIAEKRSMLQQRWDELHDHLIGLATRYDTHYAALRRAARESGEKTPPSV